MDNLSIISNQSTIKSTELVDIINEFRKVEGNETVLQHKDFMTKVRKELETLKNLKLEGERNFSLAKYEDAQGKLRPCFILNRDGMLQILNSESAFVRYKTIEYINKLEQKVKQSKQIQTTEDKQKLAEARLRNSKARQANILLKIANNVAGTYKQVLMSYASTIVTGKEIIPLPTAEQPTYSAEEIGKRLGISANMVGRIAKKHDLKTEQYGKLFHDKSKYSSKEVESFRYYESVVPVMKQILSKNKEEQ